MSCNVQHRINQNSKCTVASVNSDFNFQTHVQEVRVAVLSSARLIRNPTRLLNPDPKPPCLFGLPKLRKHNTPIRFVISFLTVSTYGLAKFLDNCFKSRDNQRRKDMKHVNRGEGDCYRSGSLDTHMIVTT